MKKVLWIFAVVIVLVIAGVILFGRKATGAAEKYKAELRAKGEKISFADWGFPKPPEDGASLLRLTNAVSQIRRTSGEAGRFTDPNFTGPGRQQVIWAGEGMPASQSSNRLSWEKFGALIQDVTNELAELRAAAEKPPRWFQYNPAGNLTNSAGFPRYPFVDMRHAAQWLYVDSLGALHVADLARARQDLHALVQFSEFNREDPTLVAAMIRVAIAGLGLQFTWQALQHTNWTEADLLAMQRDWERVDLLAAVETGFTGERAFTEIAFTISKRKGVGWITSGTASRTTASAWDNIKDQAVTMMWNADEDELFALRHHQSSLEAIRALRTGSAWPGVQALIQSHHNDLDRAIGRARGLNRFRYLLSAMVIPNTSKAVQTTVRHETLRRLTVTAIALQRFHLRHQRWPETLAELVPEFLASVPIDPLNAEPFRYRREADGGFVLYSVGEDGRDDGGDAAPTAKTLHYDWWTGRDTVWPKPANQ
jgi:hypothetical protein